MEDMIEGNARGQKKNHAKAIEEIRKVSIFSSQVAYRLRLVTDRRPLASPATSDAVGISLA